MILQLLEFRIFHHAWAERQAERCPWNGGLSVALYDCVRARTSVTRMPDDSDYSDELLHVLETALEAGSS